MNILIVILTSSVVSGLVTLVFGQFFEHKRYIQNKKLDAFHDFLNCLDKFWHTMIPEVDKKFDHWATPALGDLKKASWNIKMLSKNKSLILTIDNLVALHEKAITETRRFHLEKDFEFSFDPEKLQEEIAALRETFLIETRNEVIHWF